MKVNVPVMNFFRRIEDNIGITFAGVMHTDGTGHAVFDNKVRVRFDAFEDVVESVGKASVYMAPEDRFSFSDVTVRTPSGNAYPCTGTETEDEWKYAQGVYAILRCLEHELKALGASHIYTGNRPMGLIVYPKPIVFEVTLENDWSFVSVDDVAS